MIRRAMAPVACALAVVALGSATAVAQRRGGFGGGFGGRNRREAIRPNTPYDGRFTFVRVRYGPDYGSAPITLEQMIKQYTGPRGGFISRDGSPYMAVVASHVQPTRRFHRAAAARNSA